MSYWFSIPPPAFPGLFLLFLSSFRGFPGGFYPRVVPVVVPVVVVVVVMSVTAAGDGTFIYILCIHL